MNDGKRAALASPAGGVDSAALRALRAFHLGLPEVDSAPLRAPDGMLPALLAPFESKAIRGDYPLLLDPAEAATTSLATWLAERAAAGVLADNLVRIERAIVEALGAGVAPAAEALTTAGAAVLEQIALPAESAERFEAGLSALAEAVPEGATLLGQSRGASLHLLAHAARGQAAGRAALATEVEARMTALRALLAVEQGKDSTAIGGTLGGGADRFFNPVALQAAIGEHRGATRMAPERRARIEAALATLEALESGPSLVLVHDEGLSPDWPGAESADTPFAFAAARFDLLAEAHAGFVRAFRTAELELAEAFEPAHHEAWLAGLDWTGFTHAELLSMPPVIVLTEGGRLAGAQLAELSWLLRSGRPIQVVVAVAPRGRSR